MKGFILASLTSCLIFLGMTLSFRLRKQLPRAVDALHVYFASLAVLAVLYVLTPADLGLLSPALAAGNQRVRILTAYLTDHS